MQKFFCRNLFGFKRVDGFLYSIATFVATAALFGSLGCSSSIFTGDKGNEFDSIKGTGSFNKACLGLDLSNAELDVPTSRNLVRCLNSNGSIQEFETFVESMSDSQLSILLRTVNDKLALNYKRMKEVDRTFHQMDSQGLVVRAFNEMSKVMSNGKAIRSGITLLHKGTLTNTGELDPAIIKAVQILAKELANGASGDARRLEARDTLKRGFDIGLALTRLKSYKAIVAGLNSGIVSDENRTLESLTQSSYQYIQTKIRAPYAYAKPMLWGLADGSAFKILDEYNYGACETNTKADCNQTSMLDSRVQSVEALVRLLTGTKENRQKLFVPLVDVFGMMDSSIYCLDDTKYIPNADLFIMDQIVKQDALDVPKWLIGTNMIKLKLANAICKYPFMPAVSKDTGANVDAERTFNGLLTVLRDIAGSDFADQGGRGRPMITSAHFMRALTEADKIPVTLKDEIEDLGRYTHLLNAKTQQQLSAGLKAISSSSLDERYRRMTVRMLGDKDEAINVATNLSETLAELSRSQRDIVGNLFYLLSIPAENSTSGEKPALARSDIKSLVGVMMKLRPELGGKSIYDVFSRVIADKIEWRDLYSMLSSLSSFIDSSNEIANPAISVLREALLFNDSNPVVDLILDLIETVDTNQPFLKTFFEIADSSAFEGAVLLTSKMAANGSLRELIDGILMMYKGTTGKYPGEPQLTTIPPVRLVDVSRDQSTGDRGAWHPIPANFPSGKVGDWVNACRDMNMDFRFSRTNSKEWDAQLGALAACANMGGDNPELLSLINYARVEKTSSGRSLAPFLVDLIADFLPEAAKSTQPLYDELTDLLLDEQNFRDVISLNNLLPLLFDRKYCSQFSDDPSFSCPFRTARMSVMQSVMRAMASLNSKQDSVQEVLNWSRSVVTNPSAPKALALLRDKSNEADRVTTPIVSDEKPPLVSYPVNAYPRNRVLENLLKAAIKKYEGRDATPEILAEKTADFYRQPLSGELKEYYDGYEPNGRPKKRYGYRDAQDFKKHLKPLLDELSKGSRIEWLFSFMYYMDGSPYTPEWWARWFRQATKQVKPIAYYYPGKYPRVDKPTVILVSQLDLLELVVKDANFTLNEVKQGAGDLFGNPDENFAVKYLSRLAQSGKDLTPAVDAMGRELRFFNSVAEDPILGGALLPEVRRRLFNLLQAFPIMEEMNKAVPYTGPDGRVIEANDLGILRDIFKSILGATPEKDRNTYNRAVNSMSVVVELVQTGFLRQMSGSIWYMNKNQNIQGKVNDDQDDPDLSEVVPQKLSHVLKFLTDASIVVSGTKRSLNPDAVRILAFLLRDDCNRQNPYYRDGCVVVGANKLTDEVFNERYQFIGKLIDAFFSWTRNDNAKEDAGKTTAFTYIKRGGFEGLELMEQLRFGSGKKVDLNRLLTKIMRPILATSAGTQLLGDNLDLLEPLFTDPDSIHWVNLIRSAKDSRIYRGDQYYQYTDGQAYSDFRELVVNTVESLAVNDAKIMGTAVDLGASLLNDPNGKAARSTFKWMKKDPDYDRDQSISRIMDQVFHWFALEGTAAKTRLVRPRLVQYTSNHLGNGDVRDLLKFIGDRSKSENPSKDEVYEKLKFLGDQRYVEKLNSFLELLRSGVRDYDWQGAKIKIPATVGGRTR